jgi:O-antigen/teichoic acid export membrane protein
MAVVIAILLTILAPFIADYWVQSKQLSPLTITHAVLLMGVVVACRWPIGLYQGVLIGAQRLAVSSGINIVMVTIGNFGVVAILAFVSPTIEAFFVWQAVVNIVYASIVRYATWKIIGRLVGIRFDIAQLRNIWRFSAGMSGIALLGLLLNQIDKVILSKILPLEEFAHYVLATVVVSGLFVVVSPTFNVIYPRFTELVVAGDTKKLTDLYRIGSRVLATVIFPAAMLLAIFSENLVYVWTGNLSLASQVAPVISIMVIGTAIQGIMYFPYALQLAYGMTRLPLIICTVMLIAMVPLVIVFAWSYHALGGAMAWLAVNVLYLFLGTWLTHRYLLKNIGGQWLSQDVGIPMLLSVIAGLIGYYGIEQMTFSIYVKLEYGIVLTIITILSSALLAPKIRLWVMGQCGFGVRNVEN